MELIEQLETNTVLSRAFELIDIIANITTRNKNADAYLIKPHLSQISRSSGSIAANISEVHNFLSHKFKYSKLSISLSECRETIIHNKVLYKMGIITEAEYKLINRLCNDIANILSSSLTTLGQINEEHSSKKGGKSNERDSSVSDPQE